MKKLPLSLVVIFFIASCSKKDDIDPNLAAQVAGTYQVTRLEINGTAIPLSQTNGISVKIKLSRIDDVTVEFWMGYYISGTLDEEDRIEALLSRSGNRILLKIDGEDAGYVEGNKIILEDSDDGDTIKFEGSK